MSDIFAAMGLYRRAMHKTFQRHLKKKLEPGATGEAEDAIRKCACEVAMLYDLCFGQRNNIAICFDGNWMTRGHSSHIVVGAVVELLAAYVLDYVVLLSFCLGCELGPKPGDGGYEQWNTGFTAADAEVDWFKYF